MPSRVMPGQVIRPLAAVEVDPAPGPIALDRRMIGRLASRGSCCACTPGDPAVRTPIAQASVNTIHQVRRAP